MAGWDIPEMITNGLKVVAQWMYLKSPEQQSKKLDNEERVDAKEIKERRIAFLSKVRRYFAGKSVIVIAILLCSCSHPLTMSEREYMHAKISDLESERKQLKDLLLECMDRLDETDKCAFSY